jgi:hypothetical protein
MPDVSAATAERVALAIARATAPLVERQAVLVERCAALEARLALLAPDVSTLRERVAVVEARPAVPGPQGPAGPPGADGLTLDALTVAQEAEDPRVLTLGYRCGDVAKTIGTVRFALPLYCGTFSANRKGGYVPGDQVTYASSLWTCTAPTTVKPGTSEAWTLQVKRGEAG